MYFRKEEDVNVFSPEYVIRFLAFDFNTRFHIKTRT